MTIDELMQQHVTCKKCSGVELWGSMIWLDGECLCPECYTQAREVRDHE